MAIFSARYCPRKSRQRPPGPDGSGRLSIALRDAMGLSWQSADQWSESEELTNEDRERVAL